MNYEHVLMQKIVLSSTSKVSADWQSIKRNFNQKRGGKNRTISPPISLSDLNKWQINKTNGIRCTCQINRIVKRYKGASAARCTQLHRAWSWPATDLVAGVVSLFTSRGFASCHVIRWLTSQWRKGTDLCMQQSLKSKSKWLICSNKNG